MIGRFASSIALVAVMTMTASGAQAQVAVARCKAANPSISVSMERFDFVRYLPGKDRPDGLPVSPRMGGKIDAVVCKISRGAGGGYQFVPPVGKDEKEPAPVPGDFDASPDCVSLANVSDLKLRNVPPWDACIWVRIRD